MKLLVILFDLDIGGAQNYTINLINEFVKLGHTVSLSILTNNVLLKDRISKDVALKVWTRKSKLDFDVLHNIRNEIKDGNFDGIISFYIIYQKLASFSLRKKPLTIYPLHTTVELARKTFLLNYLVFRLKRKNEIFLTSIDSQTQYLCHAYNLKDGFFQQIYNGIDCDKFTLPPATFNRNLFLNKHQINPDHRIILMVAGFREEKRHMDAIMAFQLLTNELGNITIVFVGDNRVDERDLLQKYVDQNQIENVKLIVASEAGDVRNFYWSSHIFTLTSNKVETFPISALEAMSSGLPCVLTDVGGTKDFITPGMNGNLCAANMIADIKNKWKDTLTRYEDFDKNSIRNLVVEKYSIKRAASEYLNLIEQNKK